VHGIENVGDAPLTYYVLKHRAKKRIDPSLSSENALESGKTKDKPLTKELNFIFVHLNSFSYKIP
jgi:hypothetical protein